MMRAQPLDAGVYLDNNATTPVAAEVVEAMLPFFTEQFGNASSSHPFGDRVGCAISEARRHVQALVGADFEREIVFTSGGSEANTTAILSAVEAQPERRTIVTTAVEHPAVLRVCDHLAVKGWRVVKLSVDGRGRLDLDAYRAALSDDVALVSVMWANNETGTLFPVAEMAQAARSAGVLFHTDAVQAVGKVPIDLGSTAIDMLSLSGHKLHASKGIGALYLRSGTPFRPLLRGGGQERGRRAGTENAAGIVGLGVAAGLARSAIGHDNGAVRTLRDRLEGGIRERIGDCFVAGDVEYRLSNTTSIVFPQLEGEAVTMLLGQRGIAVSSGSACSSASLAPSHVMSAMGLPPAVAHGATRFSLSRTNTEAEIDRVIEELPSIVARLRGLAAERRRQAPTALGERLA